MLPTGQATLFNDLPSTFLFWRQYEHHTDWRNRQTEAGLYQDSEEAWRRTQVHIARPRSRFPTRRAARPLSTQSRRTSRFICCTPARSLPCGSVSRADETALKEPKAKKQSKISKQLHSFPPRAVARRLFGLSLAPLIGQAEKAFRAWPKVLFRPCPFPMPESRHQNFPRPAPVHRLLYPGLAGSFPGGSGRLGLHDFWHSPRGARTKKAGFRGRPQKSAWKNGRGRPRQGFPCPDLRCKSRKKSHSPVYCKRCWKVTLS